MVMMSRFATPTHTLTVAKPETLRDMLVRLNLLGGTDGADGALDVLAGDPFQYVAGDEAALRATVDTAGLGLRYHLTYDEIGAGAMYAFRTDNVRVRACKRNERGSWQVGCATRADRTALAALAPRIAQRTYFYAPQDAVSTQLLALTTATTTTTAAAARQSSSKRRRPQRFAVRKCVYWLADVPHCAVRIAVLTVDRACLAARRDAAMALVLAQMREMGFPDDARNRRALARHNGDLNAAVQDLL